MSIFWCDIDDTIIDFSKMARDIWMSIVLENELSMKGTYLTWNEWRAPNDIDRRLWKDIINIAHSDEYIKRATVIDPICVDALNIVNEYHDLYFVSNRRPDSYEATFHWLMNQGFEFADVICTEKDKMEIIHTGLYLIDDRPRTMIDFLYSKEVQNRKAFALMTEYNRNLTDIPNVFLAPNWRGLHYFLEREGVYA